MIEILKIIGIIVSGFFLFIGNILAINIHKVFTLKKVFGKATNYKDTVNAIYFDFPIMMVFTFLGLFVGILSLKSHYFFLLSVMPISSLWIWIAVFLFPPKFDTCKECGRGVFRTKERPNPGDNHTKKCKYRDEVDYKKYKDWKVDK